jgi:hypothetical protein
VRTSGKGGQRPTVHVLQFELVNVLGNGRFAGDLELHVHGYVFKVMGLEKRSSSMGQGGDKPY